MTEPIPFDALYEYTEPSFLQGVEISPDGEYVAFVVDEFDPADEERLSSVFVVPTDGSREPHRLTRASTGGDPQWSPDGGRLAVVAAREEDIGRRVGPEPAKSEGNKEEKTDDEEEQTQEDNGLPTEEPKPQVWLYDLELGGDPRQITEFEEGIRGFDWSPDGQRVVVEARDPTDEEVEYLRQRREKNGPIETERLQHKADGVGWLDEVTSYLFVVDIETGERERLDDAYGGGAREPWTGLQPAWSPSGDRIAFLSNRTDRPDDSNAMDVYTISADGSGVTRHTDHDVLTMSMEWGPAGEQLGFVAWNPDNWYHGGDLYVADPDAGTSRSVSSDIDRTVLGFGGINWLDEDRLVAGVGDEGLARPVVFSTTGEGPYRALPSQGRGRNMQAFDIKNETLAVQLSHPADGVDLYTATEDALFEESDLRRITALNEEFVETYHTPRAERITFENDAGDSIEAIVYLPEEFDPAEPEPHGAIMSIHGGPMAHDAPAFGFETACWTSRGYLVVKPNYRGSNSYGREFCETLRGRWGTVEVEDQLACMEALIDREWVDSERVFATGFSYGGISTGYLVTQSDMFTAAAPEHGIYDLRSSFGTGDTHGWFEQEFGLPWEAEDTYHEHSSITDIDSVDTPLLITAGGQDWRTPPTQSEQLYVSVRKQGVDAKLVVYPDEHHNLNDPDRRLHRIRELTSWFERYDPAVEGREDD